MKTHLQQSIDRHRIAPSCEAFHDVDALIPELEKHLASIECLEEAVSKQRVNATVRSSMEAYDIVAVPNETKPSQIKSALKRAWKWVLELLAKVKAAFIRGFDWVISKTRAMMSRVRKSFNKVAHGQFTPMILKVSEEEATWAPDLKVAHFDTKFYKSISNATSNITRMFSDVKVLGYTIAEAGHDTAITLARIGDTLYRAVAEVWDGQEAPARGELPSVCTFPAIRGSVPKNGDIFKSVAGLVLSLKVETVHNGEPHVGPREFRLETADRARRFMSEAEDYTEGLIKVADTCRHDITKAIESLSGRISAFASGEADVDHSNNPARYAVEILQHLYAASTKVAVIDCKYVGILAGISGRIERHQATAADYPGEDVAEAN